MSILRDDAGRCLLLFETPPAQWRASAITCTDLEHFRLKAAEAGDWGPGNQQMNFKLDVADEEISGKPARGTTHPGRRGMVPGFSLAEPSSSEEGFPL